MRCSFHTLLSFAVCAALAGSLGCSGQPAGDSSHAHGHDHGDGHDHGHAAHPAEGPHHGQLIELGNEEYHAELIHDDDTHTITLYLLDSAAKNAVPIDAQQLQLNLVVGAKPVQFSVPAASQAGDPAGKSSCFRLADEQLCKALDEPGTTCRINIAVADRHYTATVSHHHDHGEHHR